MQQDTERMVSVDLFCGIGGLTHGFIKEEINVVAGIDTDITCKYAYEANNDARFIHKDIESVTIEEINRFYANSQIRILVGCAPCQPFSSYNNKVRKTENDEWKLLHEFARIIKGVQPEIVSMENVPQLIHHSVFNEFVESLKNDYHVSWSIVFCPDYGIPQNRKRLVLFASKFGELRILKGTHSKENYKTVRETIQNLEPIGSGEISVKDPLHRARALSKINQIRIMNTPEGGSWCDWDQNLLLECHKKDKGKSYGSVYGRMNWDDPSPTITTQFVGYGNGRFGHPEQNRALSYREGSLFQTFPEYYDFIDPFRSFSGHVIARHIGNAVPVELGRIIARSIKNHIEEIRNDSNF